MAPSTPARRQKLSFQEKRELASMEAAVEAAEARKAGIEARLADPAVYTLGAAVAELRAERDAVEAEVERLYARWQELQDRE